MRVLVACEYSGAVRRAFRDMGHDAYSCDLLPAEDGEYIRHFQEDVRNVIPLGWDLMVAHPPCTHLSVSGARWFKDKQVEQAEALQFVRDLLAAPIKRIALENPISIISSRIRKPDQIIHPWQFGHGEVKATCLWLKGLPKLTPTNIVEGRHPKVHRMPPSPDRWKERSRTYAGIAQAMAEQWGGVSVCDHGIRHPWECHECADAAWAARASDEATGAT
jgi:site-specific DNA-cytosine methylase